MKKGHKSYFTRRLLEWNQHFNTRIMPWKGVKNPYFIWLSEIILQQTRVDQGLAYYEKFIEKYPKVQDLAAAPEQEVFKLWEGLGYYSRCRNLIKTAKLITTEYNGKFPESYEELLKLPGVGPYTAAALSSFAFDAPYAVVDGNVFRVLSRFFGLHTPVDSNEGKKLFAALAADLLPDESAIYNQAIMDFGATVCVPTNPRCDVCPLQQKCTAFQNEWINILPVKGKKLIKQSRYFHFLIAEKRGKILLQKRTGNDVWKDLYQFPLIETNSHDHQPDFNVFGKFSKLIELEHRFKQALTHQNIHAKFYRGKFSDIKMPPNSVWVKVSDISDYPFPQIIIRLLKNEFSSVKH